MKRRREKREKSIFASETLDAFFSRLSHILQYFQRRQNIPSPRSTRRAHFAQTAQLFRFLGVLGVVATLGATAFGCNGVRRRLTITSEPSGAVVYLNNQEIGKTPISQNFVYSGTYKIRCYKEGFEASETSYRAGTPWYLYPGFDFFSENFVPGEIRDEQRCHITLTQKREIPENELFDAATQLRDEAHNNSSLQYYVGAEEYADPNAPKNNAD